MRIFGRRRANQLTMARKFMAEMLLLQQHGNLGQGAAQKIFGGIVAEADNLKRRRGIKKAPAVANAL